MSNIYIDKRQETFFLSVTRTEIFATEKKSVEDKY